MTDSLFELADDVEESGFFDNFNSLALYEESNNNYCEMNEIGIESHDLNKEREKLRKDFLKTNISLPFLETSLLENVIIKKLWGRVMFFNGRNYEFLSYDVFGSICKEYLPKEILNRISSVKIFRSLYQYVLFGFVTTNEKMCEDTYYISFENCVVNASDLSIHFHSEEIEVSYTICANYIIGDDYDNDDDDDDDDDDDNDYPTDEFDSLLESMTGGDKDSIKLIWEMLGYVMLHVPPKRAFFWLGTEPASGKSLLGDFIQRLFGVENCSQIEADDIGRRFSMSQFISKRVNLGMESSGKLSRADVVRLKELTGNRTISIEQKGIERLDFPNYSILIFASNEAINIADSDLTDAFWERCKLIPCINSCPIEKRDTNLIEKIWDERDAIVTKAVHEAKRLIHKDFRFTEPDLARQMKAEWRKNSSSLIADFAHECLEVIPGSHGQTYFIPTEELYKHYLAYTGDNITKSGFSSQLSRYYAGKIKKSKKRIEGYKSSVHGYLNLRIRKIEESDDDSDSL